jgi:cold shock CspA family protein
MKRRNKLLHQVRRHQLRLQGLNGLNEGQKVSYEVASERGREAAVNLKVES